jgi:predicted GIY-YIG superfamily endonuclease
MASITRSNDKWRAQIYVKGERKSKVFATEEAATEWAKAQEIRLTAKGDLRELITLGLGVPNFPRRIVEAMQEAPLSREEIVDGAIPISVVCGIYFLIRGEQIVYVGQSTNVLRRIARHIYDGKTFDSFTISPCAAADLDRLESVYITALYPEENMALGKSAAAA